MSYSNPGLYQGLTSSRADPSRADQCPPQIDRRGLQPELSLSLSTRTLSHQFLAQKCVSEHARNLSAALSGVMSLWGIPSISNPTMNFRTVAERSSGG